MIKYVILIGIYCGYFKLEKIKLSKAKKIIIKNNLISLVMGILFILKINQNGKINIDILEFSIRTYGKNKISITTI